MKKLLCLSLFVMGLFVSAQAQVFYNVTNNNATNDWTVGIKASNVVILPFTLIPSGGGNASGFSPTALLPMKFRAFNAIGCQTGATLTGPVPPTSPPYLCTVNGGALTYSLTPFGPIFVFDITIN